MYFYQSFYIIDFICKLIPKMIDKQNQHLPINFQPTNQIMINSSGQQRSNNPNKNFLMVNSHIQGQSDDQILDDIESTNQIKSNKSKLAVKKSNSSSEDYVDLPKIDFLKKSEELRPRKNSRVLIDVDLIQQQLSQTPQHERSCKKQQQQLNEQQSQNAYEDSRGWDIHNIKIIPSKNNYLEQEQFQLEHRLPSKSLILKDTNQSSRHILSREKKTEEQKQAQRRIFKERERRERERNVEIVNEFLSGKASVIWLFILNQTVPESDLTAIRKIYTEHIENDYQVPICRSYQEAQKFLKLQGCFFKVVADLQSSQKLTQQCLLHKNIVAIYIYNPHKQMGINKSFELKRTSKKIKGMFFQLSQAAKQAEQEIVNEAKFIKVDNELQKQRNRLRFPSFFILSGHDKTEITAYRMCLYGSLKLKDEKERRDYLKEFTELVELRYADVPKELGHLEEYRMINHFSEDQEVKSKEILKFYVRETFYYALTNSILRISRSPEEFRPCTIPFNQTYHSIKYFYNKYRKESRSIKKMRTYRGSKLRNSDVQNLEIGGYIELLGFTSTSLKREQAEKFMDNDSFLLEIVVQTGSQSANQDFYDHGYVEINKFGLANDAYKSEQQVLFNALNIFKITALDLNSAVRKITLKYGGILDLLRSKYNDLTPHQRAVISSYEYCQKTFNGIEDDGDVLLLAEEHSKCIDYYQSKIEEGNKNYKIYGKIANAYLENGDLDEAYNNALRSIEQLRKDQKSNRKQVYKNYQKYQKNKDIFNMKQDIIHYNTTIDKYLKILGQDWFRQSKLLRQRGQKRFQAGDYKNSQSDLKKSKQILTQKQKSFEQRRKQINRRYMIRSFCCICSSSSRMQLQEQRQLQLLKIQSDEVDYHNRKDEIHQLLLQIANILKELFEKSGKKDAYNINVEQAKFHYGQLSKTNDTKSPLLQAKYIMMQASLVQKDSPTSSQHYQILIQAAIKQVKKQNKYHENIGVYNRILGSHRHNQFKRRMHLQPIRKQASQQNFKQNTNNYISLKNDDHPMIPQTEKYNYENDQQLYQKSKIAYIQAAQNIAYNKGNEHPQFITVRNEITELQLDFCQLSKSQNVARQTSQKSIVNFHSQGARCFLLLAKICLAKGELKNSFHHIQKAFQILRAALIKFDTKEYNRIFMGHPYYIDISLLKVKIFNRQLKHDLALKQLKIAKKIAKIKVENMHNRGILATIYEEQAAVLVCMGETVSFQEYITRAIEIREEEMGKYNIPNAISYSNLYKHLRNLNDSEDAANYHFKAMEIFARFPSDHPSSWILHFSNGLAFFQKGEINDAIQQFEYCMKVAAKRYSSNHVNLLKIGFQYGKLLTLMEKEDRAIAMMRDTELFLEKEMKASLKDEKIEREIDDERYLLRKNICNQLIAIFSKANYGNSLSPQNMSGIYEKKIRELQRMLVHSSTNLTKTNIILT